jgi:hypothetical protein
MPKNITELQKEKHRNNFDENSAPHEVNIGDLVWFHDFPPPISKNLKVTGKRFGPPEMQEINDTKARISVHNGKNQVINLMQLKMFLYQQDQMTTLQQKPITLNVQLNHIFLDLLKEH